ncbi:MAG: HD-GYP domain-containing protein [Thiohalophilus sp.]|jgi:HD-GYP domain-containing protein (c-di-GMP phosphodiesterase class II)
MSIEKVKVPADLLKIGMYVSELDKPWIETPFIFQGFLITNEEELDQLHQHCEYAYVDREKSQVDIPQQLERITTETSKIQIKEASPSPYLASFEEEFPRARQVYEDIQYHVKLMFKDVRIGRAIKTAEIEKSVRLMTESITRNPDAMMLLTNLKNVDEYLIMHAVNVCVISLVFARFLGFETDEMHELGMGALLHDVGELRLPPEVLHKPGELTPEEHATIQKHTAYGVSILSHTSGITGNILDIVMHHHERNNRSGYPEKLSGQEISSFAKIVGIIDVYDSLTSPAPYRNHISSIEALKTMYDWRGTLFDEVLIENFIKCLGVYPIGSTLELNSGEIGIVISTSAQSRLLPTLLLVKDHKKNFYDPPKIINLSKFVNEDEKRYEIRNIVHPEEHGVDLKRYVLREIFA